MDQKRPDPVQYQKDEGSNWDRKLPIWEHQVVST